MSVSFRMRFPSNEIEQWANRYKVPGESALQDEVSAYVKLKGYLNKDLFVRLAKWKSPRGAARHQSNDEEFIRAVTSTAFSTENERLRIEILTLLSGIDWPTASVILHFCSNERYPILDFRALWSLSVDVPKAYDFDFWREYTTFCRGLADEARVSMRVLDRALWQFSKEHQTTPSA